MDESMDRETKGIRQPVAEQMCPVPVPRPTIVILCAQEPKTVVKTPDPEAQERANQMEGAVGTPVLYSPVA